MDGFRQSPGLILPWGWWQFSGRVYLPEGASDVAALLSHGLPAIGRASASGSCGLLSQVLSATSLAPVVVGENDLKPDGHWPGREGAERCANRLAAVLQRPVELVFPPPASKDIRRITNAHGGIVRGLQPMVRLGMDWRVCCCSRAVG